jgi:hypothetical protein
MKNLPAGSVVALLIFIPTNGVLITSVCCLLNDSHSDWSKTESQCSFDLHFSDS